MASRKSATRVCASGAASLRKQPSAHRQWYRRASAIHVPTANPSKGLVQEVKRDASLPCPDPAPDSQTAAFVQQYAPYLVATYSKPPPVMEKGEGCYLWDIENRKYLDFTGGIAVNALGHCDPEFSNLIAQQAQQLIHTSNLYHNPWTGPLSSLLVQKTISSGGMHSASRVFVCNSGTEANEAALKFARKVGSLADSSGAKHEILSFAGSFHGRTLGALSATANTKYQKPFAPLIPGFKYGTYNDLSSISLITPQTCGVIVEPIQGEGGVYSASPSFLSALRKRCSEVGAVLIHDEIQCGLGRTGSLWAHSGLPESAHPDIITTAKALGNGYPVGAVIVSEDVASQIVAGDHGTTFGGNPLASRMAHYCVTRLSDPELQRHVKEMEQAFRERFEHLRQRFPELVGEVRGRGLILGLQLSRNPGPIVTAARERGLLVPTAGSNTLRFVPPLVITEQEIEEGVEILGEAMEAILKAEGKGGRVEGTKGQMEELPSST